MFLRENFCEKNIELFVSYFVNFKVSKLKV